MHLKKILRNKKTDLNFLITGFANFFVKPVLFFRGSGTLVSPRCAKISMYKKILGIDPGLADTGIGIIEGINTEIKSYSFGCITTLKNKSVSDRLFEIYSKLSNLLKTEKPDLVVVEDVFSLPINPTAGISLGKVIGVITIAVFEKKIPMVEIFPKDLKQTIAGNGNATKEQVEKSVRSLINHSEKISPFHSSDALGLAIVGLYSHLV